MVKKSHPKWLMLLFIVGVALLATPVAGQTTLSFPLAAPGSYTVGLRFMRLVDESRDNRTMDIAIWYPAIQPDKPDKQQRILGDPGQWGWLKALPDVKAAPYPLILYSHGSGGGPLDRRDSEVILASHGYVVVGLSHPQDSLQTTLLERPLDVLFVLNQFAAMTTSDLAGVIDTNNVGLLGDSLGAYTTLVMTGARIDPQLVAAWDSKPLVAGDLNDPRSDFPNFNWEQMVAHRALISPPLTSGELWPPVTDSRIHAAVMVSPCWASMIFGERGLASATVPSLIIGGTVDVICPYQPNAVYTFDHLGSSDRYLLSLIKSDHVPGITGPIAPVANQVLTAFFGKYLQGQTDDAQYLTAHYVENVEAQLKLGLLWGPYNGDK